MIRFRYIAASIIAALLVCACSRGPRVIPRSVMTRIYADMALADAAISYGGIHRSTDTCRVYGAILAQYGYDEADFALSQEKYIKDAGRYVKMIKKAVLSLDAEKQELKERKKILDALELKAKGVLAFAPHRIYLLDSLDLADTVWFDFDFQEGLDTCFAGPELIVWADTVTVKTDSTDVAL